MTKDSDDQAMKTTIMKESKRSEVHIKNQKTTTMMMGV